MSFIQKVLLRIPTPLRYTVMLQGLGLFKIPLIFAIRPKIVCMDDKQCVLKIGFRRRVKNHLNSIYFGALAIAAECTGGIAVMKEIMDSGERVSLVFSHFEAKFLKRVEGDAYFTCSNISELKAFVSRVVASGEREELPFEVVATCPDKFGDEPVALFSVTVSLKRY